jgi:hypothetical protein
MPSSGSRWTDTPADLALSRSAAKRPQAADDTRSVWSLPISSASSQAFGPRYFT